MTIIRKQFGNNASVRINTNTGIVITYRNDVRTVLYLNKGDNSFETYDKDKIFMDIRGNMVRSHYYANGYSTELFKHVTPTMFRFINNTLKV